MWVHLWWSRISCFTPLLQNPRSPFPTVSVLERPCFHSPLPSESAKGNYVTPRTQCYCPKVKGIASGQSTPPANVKKKSFSFLQESCPTVFPLLHGWWVFFTYRRGSNAQAGEGACVRAPIPELGSTLWRARSPPAQPGSSRIAPSSTCAKFDVGLILSSSPFHQTKELPCLCHTLPLKVLLWKGVMLLLNFLILGPALTVQGTGQILSLLPFPHSIRVLTPRTYCKTLVR